MPLRESAYKGEFNGLNPGYGIAGVNQGRGPRQTRRWLPHCPDGAGLDGPCKVRYHPQPLFFR